MLAQTSTFAYWTSGCCPKRLVGRWATIDMFGILYGHRRTHMHRTLGPKSKGMGTKPEEKTITKPIHGKQLVACRVLFRVPDHGGLRASRRKDTPKNSMYLSGEYLPDPHWVMEALYFVLCRYKGAANAPKPKPQNPNVGT